MTGENALLIGIFEDRNGDPISRKKKKKLSKIFRETTNELYSGHESYETMSAPLKDDMEPFDNHPGDITEGSENGQRRIRIIELAPHVLSIISLIDMDEIKIALIRQITLKIADRALNHGNEKIRRHVCWLICSKMKADNTLKDIKLRIGIQTIEGLATKCDCPKDIYQRI